MGRRARTNCSPVDSAMEKYHNDIGHRLSGVFVPSLNKTDCGDNTDFCMLTLDTRHITSVRNKQKDDRHRSDVPTENMTSTVCEYDSNKAESLDIRDEFHGLDSSSSSRMTNSFSSAQSEQEIHKDKKGIVEKLTRAIFQRKHTCSRCQRRSRSCLPNKNFNGTEKHYMCGNCRENAYAIKNLFNNLTTESTDNPSNNNNKSTSLCPETSHTMLKPRSHLKDSGYDTVTSCSTLASAYSAFNTPESREKFPKTQHSTPLSHYKTQEHFNVDNNVMCGQLEHSAKSQQNCTTATPDVNHLIVIGRQELPGGVLRQVRTRNIQDYDGYLPKVCSRYQEQICHEGKQPFTDNPNPAQTTVTSSPNQSTKSCHVCETSTKPCFRLPWQGGWLCEDCIDGML